MSGYVLWSPIIGGAAVVAMLAVIRWRNRRLQRKLDKMERRALAAAERAYNELG